MISPGVEIEDVIDWLALAKSELDREGKVSFVPDQCLCGRDTEDVGCSPIFDWEHPGNYEKGAEIKIRCEGDACGHETELAFTLEQWI